MMPIKKIQDKIKELDYRFSDHAVKRMIERSINRSEVEIAIVKGEIIEEYPNDKYTPSCLIYGATEEGKNLHIQVSLPPSIVIITIYEPDPKKWIDYKIRRLEK